MASTNVASSSGGQSAFRQDRHQALIASDHGLTRAGLAAAVAREPNLKICGEAETLEDTLALVGRLDPDLLMLDISLRNGLGIGLIRQCKKQCPRLKILVLSMHEEWLYAGHALQAGALGYLNRAATTEMVANAVRHLMHDQMYLSPELTREMLSNANGSGGVAANPIAALTDREREVFELVGRGLTAQAIARRLKLSQHTVETYRERIKTKLDVKNGADLTFRAIVWVLMNE